MLLSPPNELHCYGTANAETNRLLKGSAGHSPGETTGHLAELSFPALAGHFGHLLGHLLHHFEFLQQTVHRDHLQSAAGGDALFAAAVEDRGVLSFLGSHREAW